MWKKILKDLVIGVVASGLLIGSVFAAVHVNGYFKKNGTYVQPYYRSSPDSSPYNNYSYPGNTNPYTGVTATGNPDTYLMNYGSTSSSSTSTFYPSAPVQSNTLPTDTNVPLTTDVGVKNSDASSTFINITSKPDYMVSDKFSILGKVSKDCEQVLVVDLDGSQNVNDSYKLQKFKKGNTDFKYNASEENKNIVSGINTYVVTAVCGKKAVSESFNIYYSK